VLDRLLARLSRRYGRFAIPELTLVIVGGTVAVYVLALAQPQLLETLALDLWRVRQGEYWRLLTFLFLPPTLQPIWFFFAIYVTWLVGTALDHEWGAFKYNVYYLLGVLGTLLGATIAGEGVSALFLNVSLFLAFATLFPETEWRIFFILPIRVKWLGLLSAVWLCYMFVGGGWPVRAAVLAGIANYLLFFADQLPRLVRGQVLVVRQGAHRARLAAAEPPARPERSCAICGAREVDGADIRVCNCEKCGGRLRTLCLEHARNH
jgi:hypothetical protein